MFSPGGSSSAAVPLPPRLTPDTENMTSQPQSQLWQSISCTTDSTVASDKLKDQELAIESGTISVSSVYSQGVLEWICRMPASRCKLILETVQIVPWILLQHALLRLMIFHLITK